MNQIHRQIAEELGVRVQQVEAAVGLLDEGATVPFIARYRKEATQGLDDAQLRTLLGESDAQSLGTGVHRGARHLDCAVAVAVGLDNRHQTGLWPSDAAQLPDVVGNGF